MYFLLGIEHILDIKGIDHLVYIFVLCSSFMLRDWRNLLILSSAFTVGHSITLVLASLDFILFDKSLIETLIPLTILVSATFNLVGKGKRGAQTSFTINYVLAGCFGLIHGLGISGYLKQIIVQNANSTTWDFLQPILFFNLGIETAQIIIISLYLFSTFVIVQIMGTSLERWTTIISSIAIGISFMMILN